MKKAFLIIFASVSVLSTTPVFAQYYRFDDSESGCRNNNCEYCTTCQCTDLGAGKNYCMSLGKYCEAFGNIGAR